MILINRNWATDFMFSRKSLFLGSISREGKCPFCPPLRTTMDGGIDIAALGRQQVAGQSSTALTTPNFSPFESTSEQWADYWSRLNTFVRIHSVPEERKAQVFLTNFPWCIKCFPIWGLRNRQAKAINEITMDEILAYMKHQFDPRRFVIRERYRFWNDMQRKPGEAIPESAARIRRDAATCDFAFIRNPLDEALRTRFICSVDNEAVFKALFKINNDELDFACAIRIATETEDAA